MGKFKSPLRYPGGKSRLAPKLALLAPRNIHEYREPFLGGGSMLYHMRDRFCSASASDTYEPLVNFWKFAASNENQELVTLIETLKASHANDGRKLREFCLNALQNPNVSVTGRLKAAAFFILNRISFSGLSLSGGYSQLAFESRFCANHISVLKDVPTVFRDTSILHSSYEELLYRPGDEHTWIYLDPPYDIKADNLYGNRGNTHRGFDHVKFADDCRHSPHRWLVSYNDDPRIRELFSFARITEISAVYNMNSRNKKATELAITNY